MPSTLTRVYKRHPVISWGCSSLSVALWIIGLISVPDDLSKWAVLLASHSLTAWLTNINAADWVRFSIITIGLALFLSVNVVPALRLNKDQVERATLVAIVKAVAQEGEQFIKGNNGYGYSVADLKAKCGVWLAKVEALTQPSSAEKAAKNARGQFTSCVNQGDVCGLIGPVVQLLNEFVEMEQLKLRLPSFRPSER